MVELRNGVIVTKFPKARYSQTHHVCFKLLCDYALGVIKTRTATGDFISSLISMIILLDVLSKTIHAPFASFTRQSS